MPIVSDSILGKIPINDFFFKLKRIGPKMLDHEGKEVPGNRGYKYFGAAKDLPGVRELFEKERKYFLGCACESLRINTMNIAIY